MWPTIGLVTLRPTSTMTVCMWILASHIPHGPSWPIAGIPLHLFRFQASPSANSTSYEMITGGFPQE